MIKEYPPGIMVVPMRSRTQKPFHTTNLVVLLSEGDFDEYDDSCIIGHADALLVDPGCSTQCHSELEDLVTSLPRKLFVFLTHHHYDHTDGLSVVQKCNPDATLLAHENTFNRIDKGNWSHGYVAISGGEKIQIGGHILEAIFATGHTDGHIALLHLNSNSLIVGDHCVGHGSAVLDISSGGNMKDYFHTTYNFLKLSPHVLIPMHGRINLWPERMLCGYLKHRRDRELSILKAIENGAESLYDIVATVYADVDSSLWFAASSNVRLHVDHLAYQEKLPKGFSMRDFRSSAGTRFLLKWSFLKFGIIKVVAAVGVGALAFYFTFRDIFLMFDVYYDCINYRDLVCELTEERERERGREGERGMGRPHFFLLHSLQHLTLLCLSAASSLDSDVGALLAFRSAADPAGHLSSWNFSSSASGDPCSSWLGVSCYSGRVTRLVLQNLSLTAASPSFFPSILLLDQLRVLSLKSNSLSGPLPADFSPLKALKLLYLSHNNFSGPIPSSFSSLSRLYRLDLSFNNLSGPIPISFNLLPHLLTLHLQLNSLSGPISGLSLPALQDLNLSSNHLSGAVPPSLSSFPAAAFSGNAALCGAPFSSCSNVVSEPSHPGSGGEPPFVVSSPTSKPEASAPADQAGGSSTGEADRGGMSRVAVLVIVVGDFVVLVIVSGVLFCYFWRKFAGNPSRLHEGEKIVYSSSPYASAGPDGGASIGGFERGKMVFFGETKKFELEDLLRASAEMLGKGGLGTSYKAILDDGGVVAVKRLREVQVAGKREFEQQMDLLGRLVHPCLVPLKGYYFAGDEKLLVYDFMPGGSLFSLLHGNRGPGRTPLDWPARMRIAAAVARGLAFIHHFCRSPKLAHGNVKSTNVLIDKSGIARLSDAGLALLCPPAAGRCGGYRAPEAPPPDKRWSSQPADVYAFGVVLLEILTGKPAASSAVAAAMDLPRWVQSVVREEWTAEVFDLELLRYKGIEEAMVATLQIAMACTALSPEQRPKIGHVVRMIEDTRGCGEMEASPSADSLESTTASDDTGIHC
ncbi:putative leucine-rich repeat receptor-like protein kinase [Apostasia shenzhenica]|uniref:Putative leucine-rich repeat receptor-like protein kinase n=1 Tax=Apostasia shenzhenica TaxID=1088818 RepID=A0A2I0A115_9ASPA|nr:putative leucine-rich repeat receptor-like protein kinase [Apostasia shenzhenica]